MGYLNLKEERDKNHVKTERHNSWIFALILSLKSIIENVLISKISFNKYSHWGGPIIRERMKVEKRI